MGLDGTEAQSPEVKRLLDKHVRILKQHRESLVLYEMSPAEMWLLHTMLRLGESHPGYQEMSDQNKAAVGDFRAFCRRVWIGLGLTAEEARMLDELREEIVE